MMLKLQQDFLDKRRMALEKYLQVGRLLGPQPSTVFVHWLIMWAGAASAPGCLPQPRTPRISVPTSNYRARHVVVSIVALAGAA